MNAQPPGELALRKIVLSTVVSDLYRQPAGQGRPLPMLPELGNAKLVAKNVLVRYELVSHV
jgi:hypothetical protein